jgi:group II intron reverse transcriptase/maturase
MSVEQRDRQSLNLATGARKAYISQKNGSQLEMFPDRWTRINNRAKDKTFVFNNLHMHINVDSLREAYRALDGTKALGVDKVSKKEYGKDLTANLEDLAQRVKRGSYRPQPKREVLIPKADGRRTRPIAIACFEDKLVDWVVGRILQEVYEPLFIRNSFGFRPGKSTDQALKACYYSLEKNKRPHTVEIDFSNFFNTIPHKKLMRVLTKRISDRRFKGLIGRFLVGELIDSQGAQLAGNIGTPQGSTMSPTLANIYLHEVLDLWFLENYGSYNNVIVRYADDAVFFFKNGDDASKFKQDLNRRCQKYGLSLNEEKTRIIDMAKSGTNQFDFLGLTFYWGKQGSRRKLKVKTQKERLTKAMREFDQWIKQNRNRYRLSRLWEIAKSKIRGHINYYGYRMNALKINHFYYVAVNSLFKWLNRRSQRRSYDWLGFNERLKYFPLMLPLAKIKFKDLGRSVYVR